MILKPLSDHVVIEPLEKKAQTASGIILPETTNSEKPQEGKIIAVGPGKINEKGERIKMEIQVGDVVLFQKYGPNDFKIDGKEYLVAREDDLIAIIGQ